MGMDLVGPDLVFGGLTALYITAGILPIKDGAAGFSNTGVLTVLVLYLVAEGVSQTGGDYVLLMASKPQYLPPSSTPFIHLTFS